MEVSFGARLICPVKKLIREADSVPLKQALEENINLLGKVFENKYVQAYSGNDVYIFTRGKGDKSVNFYLNVANKSGKNSKYHFYKGFNESRLEKSAFYDALMFHLCQKYNVPSALNFKSCFEDFFNFVKMHQGLAKSGFKFKKPDYVKALPVPKALVKTQEQSGVRLISKPQKLKWKELLELSVEQAEYEILGTSIIGSSQKFGDFLKGLK